MQAQYENMPDEANIPANNMHNPDNVPNNMGNIDPNMLNLLDLMKNNARAQKILNAKDAGQNFFKENGLAFFTPFKSFTDANLTFVAPVVAPTVFLAISAVAAFIAAASAFSSVTTLAFACAEWPFKASKQEGKEEGFSKFGIAGFLGALTVACAALAIVAAVVAAIIIPLSLAHIVTRSLSTIAAPVIAFFSPNEEEPVKNVPQMRG